MSHKDCVLLSKLRTLLLLSFRVTTTFWKAPLLLDFLLLKYVSRPT